MNFRSEQKAHGPHRSPEKTVLFNEHTIIIMLIERRKNLLFTLLHLNKLESPSPKDALLQIWFKLAQRF